MVTALRSAQRVMLGAGRGVGELSGGFVGGEGRKCVGVGFREGVKRAVKRVNGRMGREVVVVA